MSYALFLDDERDPPNDGRKWRVARNYWEFRTILGIGGLPDYVSFDHDLGPDKYNGKHCAEYLCHYCYEDGVDVPEYYVHSQNPVGAKNIRDYIEWYQTEISSN